MNFVVISIRKKKWKCFIRYFFSCFSCTILSAFFYTWKKKIVERKGVSIRYSWMKRWLCVGLRKGSIGYSYIFLISSFSVPFLGQASFFFPREWKITRSPGRYKSLRSPFSITFCCNFVINIVAGYWITIYWMLDVEFLLRRLSIIFLICG